MKCFTLDSNCIIDLEENRPDAIHLEELKTLWQSGKIEIGVVSVSASENQPSGESMHNYAEFEAKLTRAGLSNARELAPIGIWDFGYWDHMLWSSDESEAQLKEIKDILFPQSQYDPPDDFSTNSKWRNQTCDALVAWSHNFHKSDHLVTRDNNFHKKAQPLIKFGIKSIVTPEEAVSIAKSI
ncbi:hypothetical protein [Ghiorsea bivora]|uniref:hypothetical protein n=1 Tax=Ghiorsea bivora TaxID=1485545 RepID=UPI000570A4F8|nr:hypothetical protein [Ghiorsea bivora]